MLSKKKDAARFLAWKGTRVQIVRAQDRHYDVADGASKAVIVLGGIVGAGLILHSVLGGK